MQSIHFLEVLEILSSVFFSAQFFLWHFWRGGFAFLDRYFSLLFKEFFKLLHLTIRKILVKFKWREKYSCHKKHGFSMKILFWIYLASDQPKFFFVMASGRRMSFKTQSSVKRPVKGHLHCLHFLIAEKISANKKLTDTHQSEKNLQLSCRKWELGKLYRSWLQFFLLIAVF